eukprot:gene18899-25457_t
MVSRHIDPLLRVAKGSELEVAQIERLRALAKRVKEDRPTTSEILAELEKISMEEVVMEDEMAMDEGEIPMTEDFDGYSLFYGCGPEEEGPAMVWSAGTNLATPLNSGQFMRLDISPTASAAEGKPRAYTKPTFNGLFASSQLNSWGILAELEKISMEEVVMEDEMAMDEGEIPMTEDFDGYSLFYGCGPEEEGPAMVWSAGTNLATPLNSGQFMRLDISPTASAAEGKPRAYTKPTFNGLFASSQLNSWILAELEKISMEEVVMEDEMAMDEGEIPMTEDFDGYSLFYGCGPEEEGPAMVWSAGTNLATPLNSGQFMRLDISPTASAAEGKPRAYTKPTFNGLFASSQLNSWVVLPTAAKTPDIWRTTPQSSEDQSTMSEHHYQNTIAGGTLGGFFPLLVVVLVHGVPPPLLPFLALGFSVWKIVL